MALWKRDNTWWADVAVNGERFRQSLKTTDKREAKALEKELIAQIKDGKVAASAGKAFGRLPFGVAADQYLKEREKRVAARTIQFEKERLVPLRRHLGKKTLVRITAGDISTYQDARIEEGVAGRTVNMEIAVLGRMLKKAKRWAMLAEDVTKFPETSHIGRALTPEEKKRLFETAAEKTEWLVALCAAVLAASTTCRGVELKSIRWKEVDLFKRVVRINRSKKESGKRSIPLNDDAMAAFARLRERADVLGFTDPDHFVFPACQRQQFDPTRHQKTWRSAWRSLTEEAGLKGFRFHDLRHTAITELAEAGTTDAALMAIAGHLTREMMEHYSHVRMEAKREAVGKLSSGLMGKPLVVAEDVARKAS
jgi:integrase